MARSIVSEHTGEDNAPGKEASRLMADVHELRRRLEEAESTLEAIRQGEVDALLIEGESGPETYTLAGADRPYRIMVEQMNEGAATITRDGTVLYANQRLAGLCDAPLEQIIGHDIRTFFRLEDRFLLDDLLQLDVGEHRAAIQAGLLKTEKEEPLPVSLSSSVYHIDGAPVHSVIVTDLSTLRREQRLREFNRELEERIVERTAEAERRARQLQALAGQLSRVEQQERKRIAQMLHDGLQQILVASKMRLASLLPKAENEKMRQGIHQVMNLIGDSIRSSRSLTVELTPPVLFEQGLAPALDWLSRHFENEHGLQITLRTKGNESAIDEDIRTFLFHAVRELLFNTVKYAKVDVAEVELAFDAEGEVRVEVRDSGAGSAAPETTPQPLGNTGFGLFSIQQRADLFGGRLQVQTSPGEGFSAVLTLPSHKAGMEVQPEAEAELAPARATKSQPQDGEAKLRVLLVDDHKVLRDGLAMLLLGQKDIELVGDAGDGATAIRLAHHLRPDVVVMDISMPGVNGIQATRRIKETLPEVRVIGLSMHEAETVSRAMLEAGAERYLPKDGAADALIEAIRGNGRSASLAE